MIRRGFQTQVSGKDSLFVEQNGNAQTSIAPVESPCGARPVLTCGIMWLIIYTGLTANIACVSTEHSLPSLKVTGRDTQSCTDRGSVLTGDFLLSEEFIALHY